MSDTKAPRTQHKNITFRVFLVVLLLIVGLGVHTASTSEKVSNKPNPSTVNNLTGKQDTMKFPTFNAKTLFGREVTFPDVVKGKIGIIFVAFEQGAQEQINSWSEPFIKKYLDNDAVAYYEIPMLSGNYKLLSGFIDGGMRGGVPESLHDKTATFYGNRDEFFSSQEITDKSLAYLFILDESGNIVFRSEGTYSEAKNTLVLDVLKPLLK
jgi:ATP10 protein